MTAWLPDPARSRAVLIGVSGYRRMPALPSVAANVHDLAAQLTDPAVWGLPPEHCTIVEDPADSSALLGAVHEAARAARDALLVYYAGHGLLDDAGELYLALPDGSRDRLPFAVRFAEVRREVVGTARRCRAKVVVLDCCFSGRALTGFMGLPGRLADQAAVDGAYLLTATAESVAALAPPGARHTAFTGALLETLREGVPGAPPILDMETLFGSVSRRLRARAHPAPQRRSRDDGHRIAIARNRAAGLPPLPDEPPPTRWPRGRRLRAAAALVTVAAAVAAVAVPISLRNAGDSGDGRAADRTTAAGSAPPATADPATTSAPPSPTADPAADIRSEELVVNMFAEKQTPDRAVQIGVTAVGDGVQFFVVTRETNCKVKADGISDTTVLRRPGGRWIRLTILGFLPDIGTPLDDDFTIPVRFKVEQGTGAPPTQTAPCT